MPIPHNIQTFIKRLPQKTGVYLFRAKRGKILYIGKAVNIKKRVHSHFSRPSFREKQLGFLKDVVKIDVIETDSEIEALLLEAALIRKHWPPYNVIWRDDKNYFYVAITGEQYPRVFLTHQISPMQKFLRFNSQFKNKSKIQIGKQDKKIKNSRYIGPFVDGKALKITLRYLRRIFPYRTCGTIPHRTCMWFDIHQKEAPCAGTMNPKEYQKTIQRLADFLEGKKTNVVRTLEKEMKEAAKKEQFEKAAELRDQLRAIRHTLAHADILTKDSSARAGAMRELKQILSLDNDPARIEGYDISNIQGKEATGSMVVFVNGEPAKEEYRKFKIKRMDIPNDVAMMREMISRRIAHPEWPMPDLMLVDGGKGQLSAARAALGIWTLKKKVVIAALAKRQNLLYLETQKNPIPLRDLPPASRNVLTHIRDEAHRFAISYHRTLRRKTFSKKSGIQR